MKISTSVVAKSLVLATLLLAACASQDGSEEPETTEGALRSGSVAIVTPASNGAVASGNVTVSGTTSGASVVSVAISVDGMHVAAATPGADGTYATWSVAIAVTSGAHTLRATATLRNGRRTSTTVSFTAGASAAPPPPPAGATGGTTGGSTTGATPPSSTATGTIVPLYSEPGGAPWTALLKAHANHPSVPIVAIINPNSGPGASLDAAFTSGIASLVSAGVTTIGYVHTSYGARAASELDAEIDSYERWYPKLQGIFFDEMSADTGRESYYAALSAYAKSKGLARTVGNPGTDTATSYVGTVDTILIYESAGVPATSKLAGWHTNYPKSNFGVIPYGVSASSLGTFPADAKPYVGFVYATDDSVPNPWDSLSSYFDTLLGKLE